MVDPQQLAEAAQGAEDRCATEGWQDHTQPCDQHDILRALAEKATDGPWDSGGDEVYAGEGETYSVIARICGEFDVQEANAAFIAACSPDVVLAVLARLDALEHENAALRERLDASSTESGPGPRPASRDATTRRIVANAHVDGLRHFAGCATRSGRPCDCPVRPRPVLADRSFCC